MANRKEVFTVCPRGEGKKDFWLRIGTAFENRDGSWSVILDALPVNGKLIVREPREEQRDDAPPPRRTNSGGGGGGSRGGRDFDNGGTDDIPFVADATIHGTWERP